MISLIVAKSSNHVIGLNNQLPWHLSADLQYFKKVTMGKPIVMGRKTHESIGKPLPKRENIVLTSQANYHSPHCTIIHSIDDIVKRAKTQDMMVIGGAKLYQSMIPHTSKIYLTIIHHEFEGDCFFPELSETEWQEEDRENHFADEKNPYDYSFIRLIRNSD